MGSKLIAVAEAVKEELNAATFSEPVTAVRHYQPLFELQDMQDLKVSVVPSAVSSLPLGRGVVQRDFKIDVAIQKKLTDSDLSELDPLMDLVQEIVDHFKFKRLSDYQSAAWVKTENAPVFAQEHMEELRQFTSVVTFTFREQAS